MIVQTFLKSRLGDPSLDIPVLHADYFPRLEALLLKMPQEVVISEWKHTMGEAAYEYHVHTGNHASKLVALYKKGVRGGNPKLVALYTKSQLEKLIQ